MWAKDEAQTRNHLQPCFVVSGSLAAWSVVVEEVVSKCSKMRRPQYVRHADKAMRSARRVDSSRMEDTDCTQDNVPVITCDVT